jgi:hypothetical protein
LRRRSIIIFAIGVYTIASETANQYTTLLGYSNGFLENDPTARYLLTISPVLETLIVLAMPVALILAAYFVGVRWNPSNRNRKRIQTTLTIIIFVTLVILATTTTYYTISDYNTLHAYHIV